MMRLKHQSTERKDKIFRINAQYNPFRASKATESLVQGNSKQAMADTSSSVS